MIASKSESQTCSLAEGSEERGLRQSRRADNHNIIQWVLLEWRHPSLGTVAKRDLKGGRAVLLPVRTVL